MMLSESQEAMLAILKVGREDEARRIFEKWAWTPPSSGGPPTPATSCATAAPWSAIAARALADDAPLYDAVDGTDPPAAPRSGHRPAAADWEDAVLTLIGCPTSPPSAGSGNSMIAM